MAPATTETNSAADIQRQMREVRAELRDDVQDLVVSAQDMADWTIYVRAYPWLCVGAALAAGYFVVPPRPVVVRPDAEGLIELAKRNKLVVKMDETEPPKKRSSLMSQLVSMAVAVLLQGGMKVVSHQLSQAMQSGGHSHGNGRPGVHTP